MLIDGAVLGLAYEGTQGDDGHWGLNLIPSKDVTDRAPRDAKEGTPSEPFKEADLRCTKDQLMV